MNLYNIWRKGAVVLVLVLLVSSLAGQLQSISAALGASESSGHTGVIPAKRQSSAPPSAHRQSSQSGKQSDPWTASQVITPAALAKALSQTSGEKPLVLHVGYPTLYRKGHIPGSRPVGPVSTPAGVHKLKLAVEHLSRTRWLVIYCGCCPWKDCPNIRPSFRILQQLKFRHVQVLALPKNFPHDWADKGLPTAK